MRCMWIALAVVTLSLCCTAAATGQNLLQAPATDVPAPQTPAPTNDSQPAAVEAATGEAPASVAPGPAASTQVVTVANVDGDPITNVDVERVLASSLGGRPIAESALARFQAEGLDQVIRKRLVERYVARATVAADPAKIDAALDEFKQFLAGRRITLDEYLQGRKMTDADLRRQTAWELGWNEYLAKSVTDQALADYFDRHRKEFDGTVVRVSHILFRVDRPRGPDAVKTVVERAEALRAQIMEGQLTFADAAQKFSEAPSRHKGGQIGYIPRFGLMVNEFASEAFQLEVDNLSEPVVSPYGVHLILCTDIRRGRKTWRDSAERLKTLVAAEIFAELAQQQRTSVKIEYLAGYPHLQPGTRELSNVAETIVPKLAESPVELDQRTPDALRTVPP